MYVIGHRGAAGLAVENSAEAITAALTCGVWAVEIDLRLTQDGEFVVSHDEVIVSSQKKYSISRMPARELTALHTANGTSLLTARQAIDQVMRDPTCMAMLDIKGKHWAKRLRDFLATLPPAALPRLILASFNLRELKEVQRAYPARKYCYHYHAMPLGINLLTARKLDAWGVGISMQGFSSLMVRASRNLNLKTVAFTVNSPRKARHLQKMGVDFIITDFPDRFAILKS